MKRQLVSLETLLALLVLTTSMLTARHVQAAQSKPIDAQDVWTLPMEALMACQAQYPPANDCLTKLMKQRGHRLKLWRSTSLRKAKAI